MKRRTFIKLSGLGAGAVWYTSCVPDFAKSSGQFPIEVLSDASVGHLIRSAHQFPNIQAGNIDVAIIGGGIAGLTAFQQLQDYNVKIFELSNLWGGTSAAHNHHDLRFALGAHYDLAYPDYFGQKGLSLLSELNVIEYNEFNALWEFKDKSLTIPSSRESTCWIDGHLYESPITHCGDIEKFNAMVRPFVGKLPMPTTLIDSSLRDLDQITFSQYIQQKGGLSEDLMRGIHYQMVDDYGGDADQVSALAGLHYYACRPYNEQDIELFSPPEGNFYFAQRLIAHAEVDRMCNNHLVYKVTPQKKGYEVHVIDTKAHEIKVYLANNVIMAGKKHTNPYLFGTDQYNLNNTYAPWVSVNIIVPKTFDLDFPKWQNDVIGLDPKFLGFVNSKSQNSLSKNLKTYTCYYCLSPENRGEALSISKNAETIVAQTIQYLEKVLEFPNIGRHVLKAVVKPMGHAMAIPGVGHLSKDCNQNAPSSLAFAGVDNGRLPLFFEALDSGIVAADRIKKTINSTGF